MGRVEMRWDAVSPIFQAGEGPVGLMLKREKIIDTNTALSIVH
jgi:hypothetical protein